MMEEEMEQDKKEEVQETTSDPDIGAGHSTCSLQGFVNETPSLAYAVIR